MAPIKIVDEVSAAQQLVPQVKRLCSSLEDFKVTSQVSYIEAGEKLKIVKARIKYVEEIKSSILDPLNEARNNTIAFFKSPLESLKGLKDSLDKKMSTWRNEQLEKERIAKEKAEAEALEKERVEKERLRKEAEEKERAAEEARKKAEAAEKKGDVKKAQVFAEKAETLKEEAKETKQEVKEVVVEAKDVKPKVEKIPELHFRRYWKARIVDANKIPREFLKPDEVAINKYVEDNKEKSVIPGVEVYFEDKSVA